MKTNIESLEVGGTEGNSDLMQQKIYLVVTSICASKFLRAWGSAKSISLELNAIRDESKCVDKE